MPRRSVVRSRRMPPTRGPPLQIRTRSSALLAYRNTANRQSGTCVADMIFWNKSTAQERPRPHPTLNLIVVAISRLFSRVLLPLPLLTMTPVGITVGSDGDEEHNPAAPPRLAYPCALCRTLINRVMAARRIRTVRGVSGFFSTSLR